MFNFYYYCPKCNQVIPFWKVKKKEKLWINAYPTDYYYWRYMCLECGNQDGVISRTERVNKLICTKDIDSFLDLFEKLEIYRRENDNLRELIDEMVHPIGGRN